MNKLFASLIVANSNLVLIMLDGSVLNKTNITSEELMNIKNAQTEEELYSYILSEEVKQEREEAIVARKRIQKQIDSLHLLEETGDFEIKNGRVYLIGINRALPEFMVNKFIEILSKNKSTYLHPYPNVIENDTEYLAFKRFTLWCIAAPHPEVLDNLFPFLEQYGLKLTKEGFYLAIRNVVTVGGTNNNFADFITDNWLRVKVNKKSPKNYFIYKSTDENNLEYYKKKEKYRQDFEIDAEYEIIDNLDVLYHNLSTNEEVKYTDAHTQTFDIRLNKWVKVLDSSKIKWDTNSCSPNGGLHFSTNSTGLCGDKSILIAINPMHVTGVGGYKGTTSAYLPIMATNVEDARALLLDQTFDSFELSFEQFEEGINANLEETIKSGYVDAIHRDTFQIPTSEEVRTIVKSLTEISKELQNRVINI